MIFYLRLDLFVTSLVSLSVQQYFGVLKVVHFVEHAFICKVRWLGLEPKFRHEAGIWELICVLTVHIIVVEMHITSSRR